MACLERDGGKRVKAAQDVFNLLEDNVIKLSLTKTVINEEKVAKTVMIDQQRTLVIKQDILKQNFDSLNNYEKVNIVQLYSFLNNCNSDLLVVWIDENNIFYSPNFRNINQKSVTLAINPLLGYQDFRRIEDWFNSVNWRIERSFLLESAVANSIKFSEVDEDYFFILKYNEHSRNVFFNAGDGVVEMGANYQEKLRCDFILSIENVEKWIGFALKGLQNHYDVLIGLKGDRLLLDYFGFDFNLKIHGIDSALAYNNTIPMRRHEPCFLDFRSGQQKLEFLISCRSPNRKNFVIHQEYLNNWSEISYESAIEKASKYFICNSDDHLLSASPSNYDKKSDDGKYYLFTELGQGYIPKEWLRLVAINGSMIDKVDIVRYLDVSIDIDVGRTIEINNKKIY